MNLSESQKLICERVVNVFETGSVCGDYGDISIFNDGPNNIRQITYGRSQTTEYGNLRELVEMYAGAGGIYSDALRKYAPIIGKTALVNDATLKTLLRRAGHEDPVMQRTQDAFFDRRYFQPAMAWAAENGFTQALSALVIYDSFIHSGGILAFLRGRFIEKTPANGGDEKAWVEAYVKARHDWLATHSKSILRATVYRTNCFAHEIGRGNWDLAQLPIIAHGAPVDAGPMNATPKPSAEVKWVQEALNKIGFQLAVDGFDGPQTQTAVMTFQQQHDLIVDGIAGVNTIAALKQALPQPNQQEIPMSVFSKFFVFLLGNSQIQSLVRTALHSAGVLLLARFGLSASGAEVAFNPIIDAILAAIAGGSGLYLSAQNASPNISNPAPVVKANPTPAA